MNARMQTFTEKELTHIHDASMDLLKNIGVAFNDDEALSIFRKNGFKVDSIYSNVAGLPFDSVSEEFAVVAQPQVFIT